MSKLSIYFSEAYGDEVKPKHVKSFGGWVFHFREDWPNEADCYKLDNDFFERNSLFCECWDEVKIELSPFGTKDKDILSETVAKLDREYNEYLTEMGVLD